MTRLLVHVEGETEEDFVNQVLVLNLYRCGFSKVSARLIGRGRQRDRRGGIQAWTVVRRDIVNHLREDPTGISTTMVDYYGMPQTGSSAWPGRAQAINLAFPKNAESIENALATDVRDQMGGNFNPDRFVPYVMMHEFEAMLFSDCKRFADGIGRPKLASKFQVIRNLFATPEEIDDSPKTAPSKRIESLVPGYKKPYMGTLAALGIGLSAIRSECPHFHSWLARIEGIPARLNV